MWADSYDPSLESAPGDCWWDCCYCRDPQPLPALSREGEPSFYEDEEE